MPRLVAVLLAGFAAGIAATWLAVRPAGPPPVAAAVERDLVVTESVTPEAAVRHRADRYRSLATITGVLALPGHFARNEAMYALAGRSDAADTQALIFEANRVADETLRAGLLGILFARLAELDAPSALAMARTEYFRGEKNLEQTVWSAWGRNDLSDALFAAATQPNEARRNSAAQSLYRAFGVTGNANTRRIEEELGIPPDLETLSRYVMGLADRSPADAIEHINGLPTSYEKLDLLLRLANYLSVTNPQGALASADRIEDATHKPRFLSIVRAAVARDDPRTVIDRVLAEGGDPGRSFEFNHAVTALATRDIDEAIAYFERAETAEARRAIGSMIAPIMAGKDPDAALEWVKANQKRAGDRNPYESIEVSLLNALARHDPARAVTEAQTLADGPRRAQILGALFDNMATREAGGVVDLLDLIEREEDRHEVEARVAMRWLQQDADAALDWILTQDEERAEQMLRQTSWATMPRNLDAAIRVLPRLPADLQPNVRMQVAQRLAEVRSPAEAQAFIRQFEGSPDYAELQASLIGGVARSDTALAWQLAGQVADPTARDNAFMAVISQQASADPREAAAWLDRIGDAAVRARAAGMIAQYWTMTDPAAALRWARNQPPGPGRDDAIMHVATQYNPAGREALELAATIEDEQKRGRAQMGIIFRMAGDDRDRARELLEGVDLPDNLRSQAEEFLVRSRSWSPR